MGRSVVDEVEEIHRSIVGDIDRLAKPSTTFDLKAYLGSPFPVTGLSMPQVRALVATVYRARRDRPVSEVNRLAARLWSGPTFDEKAVAFTLLTRYRKVLDDASWALVDRWVDHAQGWGLCDAIGMGPVAAMVFDRPVRFRDLLRWTTSKNPWRRRIAVYGLRELVHAKSFDKAFDLLERLLYDEDVWVQRAVGTWLRESWKRDRRRTEAFLRRHVKGLPPVVVTAATERASRRFREELRRKSKELQSRRSAARRHR